MPATFTYPGIYVEEVPSGVHPIAGASTSDTAFVDYFAAWPGRRGDPGHAASRTTSGASAGLDAQSRPATRCATTSERRPDGLDRAGHPRRQPAGRQPRAHRRARRRRSTLRVEAANPGAWGSNLQVAADRRPCRPTRRPSTCSSARPCPTAPAAPRSWPARSTATSPWTVDGRDARGRRRQRRIEPGHASASRRRHRPGTEPGDADPGQRRPAGRRPGSRCPRSATPP